MFLYLHEGWSYKAFGTIYVLPPQVVPIHVSGLADGLGLQCQKPTIHASPITQERLPACCQVYRECR